jgi:predicted choloylglycine hydrolase
MICALSAGACNSIQTAAPATIEADIPVTTPTTFPVAFWSIQSLPSFFPVRMIEVAGSYEEIGHALGKWYQSQGYTPSSLNASQQEKARELIAFYDSVKPSINKQLRGVYAAYGLSLDEAGQGIPIWDDQGIRILLPGLVEQHSCSVVFSRPEIADDKHARLGRNHDWPESLTDTLLVFTYPPVGYPTVVMTRGTPGFTANDGMNSQGLAFGLASVNNLGYRTPDGPSLPSNSAYRLVLENSANVEEAIDMLQSIPIAFINPSPDEVISHILLADRSGASAVVEFLPQGIVVSHADTPYQVMTNSNWAGTADQPGCPRYRTAVAELEKARGKLDTEGLVSVMASIRSSTQWTVVYDLEDLSLVLTLPGDDFSTPHWFSLAEFMSRMENP